MRLVTVGILRNPPAMALSYWASPSTGRAPSVPFSAAAHLQIIRLVIAPQYQSLRQVMRAWGIRAQYNVSLERRVDADQSGVARRSLTLPSAKKWLAAKIGQHTARGASQPERTPVVGKSAGLKSKC